MSAVLLSKELDSFPDGTPLESRIDLYNLRRTLEDYEERSDTFMIAVSRSASKMRRTNVLDSEMTNRLFTEQLTIGEKDVGDLMTKDGQTLFNAVETLDAKWMRLQQVTPSNKIETIDPRQIKNLILNEQNDHATVIFMGEEITVDSATLMNKGLEVIEAKWLFDLEIDQIEVVVHPQSIIHSAVQFQDGSIIAQLGVPDMKIPIQYALGFPKRMKNNFNRFNFLDSPDLTFEKVDRKTFRNLDLAYKSIEKGGNSPCVLNAANEIVVEAFLNDSIGFLSMSDIIENCLEKITFVANPSLDDYVDTDKEARVLAKQLL